MFVSVSEFKSPTFFTGLVVVDPGMMHEVYALIKRFGMIQLLRINRVMYDFYICIVWRNV